MSNADAEPHMHLAYFGSELDCSICNPQCKGHSHSFYGYFINCGEPGCGIRPVRIQRQRTKGWKLPSNTRCVNRPLKYANPFKLGDRMPDGVILTRENFKPYYRTWLLLNYSIEEIQHDCKGRNIACFCGNGLECHGDVVLEVANP